MILPGNRVKILKGYYKGETGVITSFDGFWFNVKLMNKELEVKIGEDEFEKIVDEEEELENRVKIKANDGTELILKDIDRRYTSSCLRNNGFFKGLFSLGKYYAKEQYPEKYNNDYFTRQIITLKNFDRRAAENIANIYYKFISKSVVLKNIIELIDYICFMPTIYYRNHVEQWGKILCERLGLKDISYIIRIPFNKRKLLSNYKKQYAQNRAKIIDGAFQIRKNDLKLKDKSCLILDDVCTTGLQINELTITLVSEGIKEVYAFVIGRAKY